MDFLGLLRRGEPPATTLSQAQEVLGEPNVFDVTRVEKAWGHLRLGNPTIPYDLATLRAKAKENLAGARQWTLVYVIGLSLASQLEKLGRNPNQLPCFMETGVWEDPDYAVLIVESGACGYRLLDFSLPHKNLDFAGQKAAIDKNRKHQRVSARTVSEAALSMLMVSGSCPLTLCHHTAAQVGEDSVLRLVYEPKLGLALIVCPDSPRPDAGTVICKMYDIAPRK